MINYKKELQYILKHISFLLDVPTSLTELLIWVIPKWNNRLGLLASINKGKSRHNLGSQIWIIKFFLLLGILNLLCSSWYCLNYPFRYLNTQDSQIRKDHRRKWRLINVHLIMDISVKEGLPNFKAGSFLIWGNLNYIYFKH